jgi:hypothetical protein
MCTIFEIWIFPLLQHAQVFRRIREAMSIPDLQTDEIRIGYYQTREGFR